MSSGPSQGSSCTVRAGNAGLRSAPRPHHGPEEGGRAAGVHRVLAAPETMPQFSPKSWILPGDYRKAGGSWVFRSRASCISKFSSVSRLGGRAVGSCWVQQLSSLHVPSYVHMYALCRCVSRTGRKDSLVVKSSEPKDIGCFCSQRGHALGLVPEEVLSSRCHRSPAGRAGGAGPGASGCWWLRS